MSQGGLGAAASAGPRAVSVTGRGASSQAKRHAGRNGTSAAAHPRRPAQIIAELLTGHPEAASLLAEAIHCQALARSSAANVGQDSAAAETARLHYEELYTCSIPLFAHDPLGAGLLLLLVLGAGQTMLDGIELSVLLGGVRLVLGALAATAVWLTGGWLAALASRKRRWPLVLATIKSAILWHCC